MKYGTWFFGYMITSERETRNKFLLITNEAEGRASSTENKEKS